MAISACKKHPNQVYYSSVPKENPPEFYSACPNYEFFLLTGKIYPDGSTPLCDLWRCPCHGKQERQHCYDHWHRYLDTSIQWYTQVCHFNKYLSSAQITAFVAYIRRTVSRLYRGSVTYAFIHYKNGDWHVHFAFGHKQEVCWERIFDVNSTSCSILVYTTPLVWADFRAEDNIGEWLRYQCRLDRQLDDNELPPPKKRYRWYYGLVRTKKVSRLKKKKDNTPRRRFQPPLHEQKPTCTVAQLQNRIRILSANITAPRGTGRPCADGGGNIGILDALYCRPQHPPVSDLPHYRLTKLSRAPPGAFIG